MLWWAVGAPAGCRGRFSVFPKPGSCAGGGEGGFPEKGFQTWGGRLPSYLPRYRRMPFLLRFFFLWMPKFHQAGKTPSLGKKNSLRPARPPSVFVFAPAMP